MSLFSTQGNSPRTLPGGDISLWNRVTGFYDRLAFPLLIRAEFYSAMADFGSSRIAPHAAIAEMSKIARRRWSKKSLVRVYEDILATMAEGAEGKGLARALIRWVPPSEAVMLLGAQASGPETLNAAFRELGQLLGRQAEAKKKLRKSFGVNLFNLALIVGVMFEVIESMVPVVDKSATPAAQAQMPFAMLYFSVSEWLLRNGLLLLGSGAIFTAFIAWCLPNWYGERRRFFDTWVPPFNIYQRLQTTLFLSTAAAMLRATITLNAIISDMAENSTPWLTYHLQTMERALKDGAGPVEALSKGPLPNDTADSLSVYRLIPRFQDVMTRLSEINFKLYEQSIETISSAMGIASTFVMAGFSVATMIAMFQFADAMKSSSGQ